MNVVEKNAERERVEIRECEEKLGHKGEFRVINGFQSIFVKN